MDAFCSKIFQFGQAHPRNSTATFSAKVRLRLDTDAVIHCSVIQFPFYKMSSFPSPAPSLLSALDMALPIEDADPSLSVFWCLGPPCLFS
jgi:hypothetical protein